MDGNFNGMNNSNSYTPQDNMQQPTGTDAYGQAPMGGNAYGQQPMGGNTYGQQSMGGNTYGQQSMGYGQTSMGGGMYQQPMGGGYGQSPMGGSNYMGDLEEPVSLGDWIIAYLLMCVPCVNLIMLFVWGFSSGTKKSKANWAKAQLIVIGVIFVIYIIIFAIAGASMAGFAQRYANY